ncbi:hypothetical protein BQ8420_19325 [Nocardiopsis sp. JB363]|nr:hypothetical protein BQ8420_19325 [Nocardiopsis sp. JB363]
MATVRARYTGETLQQAQAGIARGARNHGLDTCAPRQHALRAFLALAVYNRNSEGAPPRWWGAHTITAYTIHVSARFDDCVIFTDTPWNVAHYFLSRQAEEYVVPGLRAVCACLDHYRLLHVPTGAVLTIRGEGTYEDQRTCAEPCPGSIHERYLSVGNPLTAAEESELDTVPPASQSAQVLLAGLFTRTVLSAPDRSWTTGGWYYAPPGVRSAIPYQYSGSRMLWGSGDHWMLRWTGFPNAEFIASALTDETIGLAGATAEPSGNDLVVRYGDTELRLVEYHRHLLGSTPLILSKVRQE